MILNDCYFLGLVEVEDDDHNVLELDLMDDGKPFTGMMYTNGPGFEYHRMVNETEISRKDLTNETNLGMCRKKTPLLK